MISTLVTTTASIGGIELVEQIPNTGNAKIDLIKLILQAVIMVGAVIKIFKKPKEVISNQNQQ